MRADRVGAKLGIQVRCADMVHGVEYDAEVQAASVWTSGDTGWACWTGVSGWHLWSARGSLSLLDQGVWGSISDLLGDLSALSSYEDALAEAMYEELDHLVTQKESLLGSPGGCLCLPFWDLRCTFIVSLCVTKVSVPADIQYLHIQNLFWIKMLRNNLTFSKYIKIQVIMHTIPNKSWGIITSSMRHRWRGFIFLEAFISVLVPELFRSSF